MSEMSQTINLKNRLGRKPTIEELEAFGEQAIELINQRTLSNQQVGGGRFQAYSKEYAAKKGVSRNSVDLFLDGDMLGALDYEINERSGTVKILLQDSEVPKGYNHHKGDTLPKRPWFGLTPDETTSLVALSEIEETQEIEGPTERRTTLQDIERALSLIDLEFIDGES